MKWYLVVYVVPGEVQYQLAWIESQNWEGVQDKVEAITQKKCYMRHLPFAGSPGDHPCTELLIVGRDFLIA